MNYEEKIQKIETHIRNNVGQPLHLAEMARMAHCSTFHFHRIFKAMTGETLKSFTVRIRMEHAATLLKNTDYDAAEIGHRVGYEFPESFSRAFQHHYGRSPSQFRGEKRPVFQSKVEEAIQRRISEKVIPVTFRDLPETPLICVAHEGDYNDVGKAWGQLFQSVQLKGFPQSFGVSYSDPAITDTLKIRYDACVLKSSTSGYSPPAFERLLAGGKYAIARHQGPYHQLNETYELLFGLWLPSSYKRLRDEPCLENYLNDPRTTKEADLVTEIMMPIE